MANIHLMSDEMQTSDQTDIGTNSIIKELLEIETLPLCC